MLTLAYIGNGKSTNRYHLPFVLTRTDTFKVKTIYSRTNKGTWMPIPGVNYVHDLQTIYQDPEIDLVVITTPSPTHFQLAKETLEAGKNVLLEKPFTETRQEAQDLFDLAQAKGLFIQAYQNRRFDSDFLTLQKVIESGKLGDLHEIEMSFDYFRPQTPQSVDHYERINSFVYGHACHTLDQVISYFGRPQAVHYDVKQLLGSGRMNDYFDVDMYYDFPLKVSVKSSYFRIKARPSFVAYGSKGMFVKASKDRQEEHLKLFYLPGPGHEDFGVDLPEHYGTLTYVDDQDNYHEEKVISEVGDYGRIYDGVYQSLVHGQAKLVEDQETLTQIDLLEQITANLK